MDAHRRALVAGLPTALAIASLPANKTAFAGGPLVLPPELAKDEFIMKLLELITAWNTKEIKLPSRDDLRDKFVEQVNEDVKTPTFFYENKEWAEESIKKFDLLPKKVYPKLQLDDLARSILILVYGNNLRLIRKEFQKPDAMFVDPTDLDPKIALPTFIVFGSAQQQSLEKGLTQISAIEVSDSIYQNWSRVWPFSVWKKILS